MKKQSQFQKVLGYLRGKKRTLTRSQAMQRFKIKNLPARISEIRQAGYKVNKVKNRVGKTAYSIVSR